MDLILDATFGDGAHAQALIQDKADAYAAKVQRAINNLAGVFAAAGQQAGKTVAYSSGEGFNKTLKDIRFGEELTDNLADELRDGVKNDIKDAMEDVKWAIAHPLAQARQAAQIEGALTTLEYKRGLASNTPGVNAVIDQQIMVLRGKWSELTGVAYEKGVDAANALERGLRTFNAPSFPVFGGSRDKKKKKPAGENPGGGGRAGGGWVEPGQTYLIGENGPEELHMGTGGGNGYVGNGRGRGGSGGINVLVSLSNRHVSHQQRHYADIQKRSGGFV